MNQEEMFGNEFKWFDRTAIMSFNTLWNEYIIPSQRTIPQKFQIETQKALLKLKEMKLIDPEIENNYLSSHLFKSISEIEATYNPGAFALLTFIIEDYRTLRTSHVKMNELFNFISEPDTYLVADDMNASSLFNEYILQYGITCEDLIRYIIFIQNFN